MLNGEPLVGEAQDEEMEELEEDITQEVTRVDLQSLSRS